MEVRLGGLGCSTGGVGGWVDAARVGDTCVYKSILIVFAYCIITIPSAFCYCLCSIENKEKVD